MHITIPFRGSIALNERWWCVYKKYHTVIGFSIVMTQYRLQSYIDSTKSICVGPYFFIFPLDYFSLSLHVQGSLVLFLGFSLVSTFYLYRILIFLSTLQSCSLPSNILFPFLVSRPSLNSNLNLSMGIHRSSYFLLKMEWHSVSSFHSSPFDGHDVHHGALDCRASSLSYLSLNCSYSDFFIPAFSGRSESHLLFPSRS